MKVFLAFVLVSFVVAQDRHHHDHPGPGPNMMRRCCNDTKTRDATSQAEMDSYKTACREELGYSTSEKERKNFGHLACLSECVAKKMNLIDSNTNLNENDYTTLVTNVLALEDYQKSIAATVASTCIQLLKTNYTTVLIDNCSTIQLDAVECVDREFFKACPTTLQSTSDDCAQFREMVENGLPLRPPPPPNHQ